MPHSKSTNRCIPRALRFINIENPRKVDVHLQEHQSSCRATNVQEEKLHIKCKRCSYPFRAKVNRSDRLLITVLDKPSLDVLEQTAEQEAVKEEN